MTQPTLFDALYKPSAGCEQVVNKEKDNGKDNEKENSPHTPLKGKETGKETGKEIPPPPPPCRSLQSAPARTPAHTPAQGAAKVVVVEMRNSGKGVLISADSLEEADKAAAVVVKYLKTPPIVIRLHLYELDKLNDEYFTRNLYLQGMGQEFVPLHYNAEAIRLAAYVRRYLAATLINGKRLIITTTLAADRFAKRYGQEFLELLLSRLIPMKLRRIRRRQK